MKKLILMVALFLSVNTFAQTDLPNFNTKFPNDNQGRPVSILYGYIADNGDTVFVPAKFDSEGNLYVNIAGAASGGSGLSVSDSALSVKVDSLVRIYTNTWRPDKDAVATYDSLTVLALTGAIQTAFDSMIVIQTSMWDKALASTTSTRNNPEWAHVTAPLEVMSFTNLNAAASGDSTQQVFNVFTFPRFSLQWIGVDGGVNYKLFATSNPDASDTNPYDGNWEPISLEFLGNASGLTDTDKLLVKGSGFPVYKIMCKAWTSDATNTFSLFVIKSL